MKQSSVPILVLSARQDDVELVNQTLREAGHRAQCHWNESLQQFGDSLAELDPHLIVFFSDTLGAKLFEVSRLRQEHSSRIPLLIVSDTVDENAIADALLSGAQDMVSTSQRERLKAVASRELRTYRLERTLNRTLESANHYKAQLKSLMDGSVDAIAQVQEGIVVDANQAWSALLGREHADSTHAPLMDFVDAGSHAALKGALIASMKGKWDGTALRIDVRTSDGRKMPIEVGLERALFDGDPSVKLTVRRPAEQPEKPEALVERTVNADPVTGMNNRVRFLELLKQKLVERTSAGSRALALIRIDKFGQLQEEVGPLASEDIIAQTARLVRGLLGKHDVAGRFGGTTFAVLLERGTLRDIRAWGEHVIERIAEAILEVEGRTLSVTCTIGVAEFGPDTAHIEPLVRTAERANSRGRADGGDRIIVEEASDESTQIKRLDALWSHQIRSALLENRFRLVHLGIASLIGPTKKMIDTVLRLIDQQGDEVAASEFMPSARRNSLARSIDRWVVGASIAYCTSHPCDMLFMKLTEDSIADEEIVDWMTKQCREKSVAPGRLCVQLTEADATQYLKQAHALSKKLRAAGFRFAIEHFGIGRDPVRLLNLLPTDYIKIDGSLMQAVGSSPEAQAKVKSLISAARQINVATIAERVDDANTMAVLFQLGIGYMQGHYVHEPEVVLSESA